ncbi:putative pectin lyase A [Aspergillus pseudotamarii]|uniref:pectin lyase n=2 Tax=Aspergillus subgen. Circumdati TaxID=2720871 RepID=A0A5N6TAH8_ASPPS|nr:putative pectin lyase A [Aspergillus pseudotamarii]KAE8143375.1 putative pectin lyase A [Aspergillus pseudotamarii]KAE8422410.1 putative pectin lyase A [Aspergillus pseudocaelatus]
MKITSTIPAVLLGLAPLSAAVSVSGAAEGFASGVTGGGDAEAQIPSDIDELKEWLTDDTPRVIVLDKEYDFTESEGTTSGTVCASWGTGDGCQKIIQDDCGDSPSSQATWYTAGTTGIDVASDKTILGDGDKGVIKGKGLRFRDGVSNIIVQNIEISDLNPEYVWGGDAIYFDGSDLIWIDHVTTARTGRQHYTFGYETNTRITLSNNFINGETTYSTGCDGYTYWGFEMVGEADQITLQNNYIYMTAGRSPALSGGTLLHAVNNVWEKNNGHALEGGEAAARGIFEGNAWVGVSTIVGDYAGRLFNTPDSSSAGDCESALGRACEVNAVSDSGSLTSYTDTSFFSDFSGLTIAPATSATEAQSNVPNNAGMGKL